MGLLDRLTTRRKAEYIPAAEANVPATARARNYGTDLANRAGEIYKQNPKLVKTIASGALLVAAAAFAKRKGYM